MEFCIKEKETSDNSTTYGIESTDSVIGEVTLTHTDTIKVVGDFGGLTRFKLEDTTGIVNKGKTFNTYKVNINTKLGIIYQVEEGKLFLKQRYYQLHYNNMEYNAYGLNLDNMKKIAIYAGKNQIAIIDFDTDSSYTIRVKYDNHAIIAIIFVCYREVTKFECLQKNADITFNKKPKFDYINTF